MLRVLFPAVLLFSCLGSDRKADNASFDNLFFHYDVQASGEGEEEVTVKVQFRLDDFNGAVVRPAIPLEVLFDGQPLASGDSRYTGAYYEIQLPRQGFEGRHQIVIQSEGSVLRKDSFYFQPFTLIGFPDTLRRGEDLSLQLSGLGSADLVQLLLTDTAFTHDGLEQRLQLRENGDIRIPAAALSVLAPGPLQLLLTRETEEPIRAARGPGGVLTSQYPLRRELFMAE